jgi:ribulose kinase
MQSATKVSSLNPPPEQVELDEQDMERYRQLEQHTLKRAAAAMREVQRCERELERLRSR